MSGANTAVNTALAASTHTISTPVAVTFVRPRSAVTRCEIGLISTNVRSHPGIAVGWTKMLLANVSGNRTVSPRLMIALGERATRPTVFHTQPMPNANTQTRDRWLGALR